MRAVITVVLLALVTIAFLSAPALVDRSLNRVVQRQPSEPSHAARALFERLFISDLHADSLLWGRDLARRGSRGHVDVPRLVEGRVALQAFTIVTKAPLGQNIDRTHDRFDLVTLLMIARRLPRATWSSLAERALHQAADLDDLVARSDGRLAVIRTRSDLDAYLERRRDSDDITAAFLGVEGAHALDGDLATLERFGAAGIRMLAPTHFVDTRLGGSAHGLDKGGLTPMGAEMIATMERLGMTLDLAHASPALIDDAVALATRPVVVSHTGVKGTCDNNRNISDRHLRAIADTGGVVGIGYWNTAVCGSNPAAIARAIRHAVDVAGADHVALGSDFDGAVATPFDTTGLVELVDALLAEGLANQDVAAVMGENVVRVLRANLPAS